MVAAARLTLSDPISCPIIHLVPPSIARRADEGYAYIQVSLSVAEKAAEKREHRPFSPVRDNCPQHLLTLDPLPLERDGATRQNLVGLMASGSELKGRSEGERVR